MRTARVAPEKTAPPPVLPLRAYIADGSENHMAKMSYAEQLKHPNWQRKRLERLESSGWSCEDCGDTEKTLHVHHRRYVKGRMAWEYEDVELVVLCESCHELAHDSKRLLDEFLATSPYTAVDLCIGLLAGHMFANCELSEELEIRCANGREPYFEEGIVAAILTPDEIRSVVRAIAAQRSTTPTVRNLIADWDEREAKYGSMQGDE